jgi:hypothetical protein
MKYKVPLGVLVFMAILGLAEVFIPHPTWERSHEVLRNNFLRVIGACALILGIGNLIRHHVMVVRGKKRHWPHSAVLLAALGVSLTIGLFGGVTGDGVLPTSAGTFQFDIQTIYEEMIIPLGATMFSLLAFFMASAAYRSFRARNVLAFVLLLAAFVVMLGQVPLGHSISPWIPRISDWIMRVPNTASKRGIALGVCLGMIATMLKVMLGIERSWMGGSS